MLHKFAKIKKKTTMFVFNKSKNLMIWNINKKAT